MFVRQSLTAILHLFVVSAFFFATFLFVSLPYLPHLQDRLINNSTSIGLGLFIVSFILLVGFYMLNRGKYLTIKMGTKADINIVRQTIEECFVKNFPKQISLKDLEISKKSRIEIRVSVVKVEQKAQKEFLLQVERQLSSILRERFGYVKPFYVFLPDKT